MVPPAGSLRWPGLHPPFTPAPLYMNLKSWGRWALEVSPLAESLRYTANVGCNPTLSCTSSLRPRRSARHIREQRASRLGRFGGLPFNICAWWSGGLV